MPTAARSISLTSTEADALRRAAFHVFGQALRWAADEVDVRHVADDPDPERCVVTVRAFDEAENLLDFLGWKKGSGPAELKPDAYVRGVVVLALEFHKHEAPILQIGQYDTLVWLSGRMDDAGWPQLTEDEAWDVVFRGKS